MNTSVEGSKRQLPPWMVQKKVVASHVSNSDNVAETYCHVEKGDIAANAGDVTKKIAGVDRKRETSKRKSNLDAKCEVKRSRNLRQKEGSGDDIVQKKKEKGDRCRDGVRKSSRKKGKILEDPGHGSRDVSPVQVSSDDDVELTMEDLMAIAEQYVKDHENKERQETSGRRCEPKLLIPATSESGTALDSACENKKSSSSAREALDNSTLTTTGELVTTSTSQTDNPAQDMLDLLLGPLLRNLPEKKNKSIVDSIEFTHKFTGQSQDELIGEEMPPLMKKRNTLKDKVAMFLD